MDRLSEQIDALASKSRRLKNPTLCRDMLHLCDNAHQILVELSRELVECRRKNKLTPHSEDLLNKLDEQIKTAEKMLTYAQLMDK